nr:ARID DNA-binding domain-containing protein [Tanacetum cinerariifolium]
MDVDKMRQRHNDYLDDYFESLVKERANKRGEMARFVEDTNASEDHTFYEFVAFLNLIKNDDIISKGWDIYKKIFDKVLEWFYNHYLKRQLSETIPPIIHGVPIYLSDLYKLMDCMGVYLSVQFVQEFSAIAGIRGLTRSDGEEIRKCYIVQAGGSRTLKLERKSSNKADGSPLTRVAVDNGECSSRRRLCSHAVLATTLVTPRYSTSALQRSSAGA